MSTQLPPDPDSLDNEHDDSTPTSNQDEILAWLDQLRRSDRSLYNLMALEVWSLAHTMDNLVPGFWNRFMENRQLALQEFLAQHKAQQSNAPSNELVHPEQEEGGMMEGEEGSR